MTGKNDGILVLVYHFRFVHYADERKIRHQPAGTAAERTGQAPKNDYAAGRNRSGKRPEEKDDAEKQTALQLPQPAAGTSAPLPQKQPRRPQTPDHGDGVNITFLGQKLITWIAGFAAVLGFFYFIRYSIENGLLGPVARLTAATLGGLLLTGAGCLLHYKRNVANHQRIGEALLGAGIAALYFAAYALAKSISWHRKAFLSR